MRTFKVMSGDNVLMTIEIERELTLGDILNSYGFPGVDPESLVLVEVTE